MMNKVTKLRRDGKDNLDEFIEKFNHGEFTKALIVCETVDGTPDYYLLVDDTYYSYIGMLNTIAMMLMAYSVLEDYLEEE